MDESFVVSNQSGRFVVDFFCASERLIVEVDGGIHELQKDLDEQQAATFGIFRIAVCEGQ